MGADCGIFCGMGLFGEPATLHADYQVIYIEAILASHKAMCMVMISCTQL